MTPPPLPPPPPPADPSCPPPAEQESDVEERDPLTWMSWSAAIAMNA